MWLAVSIMLLVATLALIWYSYHTSPEATDLTYQIVKRAIQYTPWLPFSTHQVILLSYSHVMVCNKTNSDLMKYKLYVRIEDGHAIVSKFCEHGVTDTKVALGHPNSVRELGATINGIVAEHLSKGCNVYAQNYDF